MEEFALNFAGLQVSWAGTSLCVVDDDEKTAREAEAARELETAGDVARRAVPAASLRRHGDRRADGQLCEDMTDLGVPNHICMYERYAHTAIVAMADRHKK